jgi:Glyoxalase-like domain
MRIRQIVFAARDLKEGSAALAGLLDLDPPFRDPGVAEFGLDNAVFAFGDQFIEIVAPVRDGTTAGRLLERRGDSGYMVILQTDDLARERERFGALGVRTVFEAEYPDIRAVHLHPKDIGGAIVSVDEPRPPASWRWGGPDGRVASGKPGKQRVLGVSIDAADPRAMAARWAQVLGLAAPVAAGPGWRLALRGGLLDFVAAGPRGEGIGGYTLAVVDPAAVLQSARTRGLAVEQQAATLFGARIDLRPLAQAVPR